MFYILSKTIDIFAMPLTLAFLAFFYALRTKHPKRGRWALSGGMLWLYVTSNPLLVNQMLIAWEYPKTSPAQLTKPLEVGIVLTGGMVKDFEKSSKHVWTGKEFDRGAQAFQLYRTGQIKKIMISGGLGHMLNDTIVTYDESEATRQYLIRSGVDSADIMLEHRARNTHENAQYAARLLRTRFKTNECVLITSAFHLPRAMGCFRKVGLKPVPFASSFLQIKPYYWVDQLFPSEESLHYFYLIWHEWIGYVIYRTLGYL
jgi:uncharacterized SAM-binding protein YcdF (DUF218 family)